MEFHEKGEDSRYLMVAHAEPDFDYGFDNHLAAVFYSLCLCQGQGPFRRLVVQSEAPAFCSMPLFFAFIRPDDRCEPLRGHSTRWPLAGPGSLTINSPSPRSSSWGQPIREGQVRSSSTDCRPFTIAAGRPYGFAVGARGGLGCRCC